MLMGRKRKKKIGKSGTRTIFERNIADSFPELIKNITSHVGKTVFIKLNISMENCSVTNSVKEKWHWIT